MPLHAALDLAALRTRRSHTQHGAGPREPGTPAKAAAGRGRRPRRYSLLTAVATATLLMGLSSTGTLASTTVTPKCDAVNLRTGPSTNNTKKTSVNSGAKLTVVATISGNSYRASCAGTALSGSSWHKISAINGVSVKTKYGVSYLYGASKLFKTVTTLAVAAVTPAPSAVPPAAPPTAAPTTAPPTTFAAICDSVNLRSGAGTKNAVKTSIREGATITAATTVSGGSWTTSCKGESLSGTTWRKISAIGGVSVSSTYGVSYLYGASGLFTTVAAQAPTSTPTDAPDATTDPGSSADPSDTPGPTATPGPITLSDTITIFGRGYGHGVGLSQYGAKGRALDGQSAEQILAHYYTGTSLGTMTNNEIRVLVLQSFGATATNPVQVYGRGATWTIDGVDETFPVDGRLKFTPTVSGSTTTWKVLVTAADGSTLYSASSSSSVRVRSGTGSTLQLWSTSSGYDRFRGALRLIGKTDGTSTVNVVNELPMESYLKGVVPAEISAGWPTESIRAQTIAARSYAEYRLHPTTGTYDVYNDTRSQVYLGYLAEKTATTAGITATAGQVLRTSSGGKVTALFHSAGGGATENNDNVFVSATGAKVAGVFSYLRGSMDRRPDGTAYDDTSPYTTWKTRTYTLAQIQAWFAADSRSNVGTLVAIDLRNRGVSGRLISVTLIGADGTTKRVSGDVFRSIFNAKRPSGDAMIRSTLFDLAPVP